MRTLLAVVGLCAFLQCYVCDSLFDIDQAAAITMKPTDDGSLELIPDGNFPFFGQNVTKFYIGMNGIISIDTPVSAYDTSGWPANSFALIGTSAILPFWSDVNGYVQGEVKTRQALPSELGSLKNLIIASRQPITALNIQSATLIQWKDVTPCGCFFPRNTIQAALITDGCSSYAILAYPSILWGNDEGARAGMVRISPNVHTEFPASQTRNLESLVSGKQILYFGGENICTGKIAGQIVQQPNSQNFIVCGACSVAQTTTCTTGKSYDPLCGKCVTNPFPNCDNSVDGNYTAWQNQGSCSTTCGVGLQLQVRFCTNPSPKFGGRDCSSLGSSSQNIPCNVGSCPVNGNYSIWQNQGSCSATCGAGLQLQVRFCTNPIPQFGGQDCSSLGPSSQNIPCNVGSCPVNGNYSIWQNQGSCSATCGAGLQLQVRFCTNPIPQFGGQDCSSLGPSSQNILCNAGACPVNGNYSIWQNQGSCSATCGAGLQLQVRFCTNPIPQFGGQDCSSLGPSSQNIPCNVGTCPVNGNYSIWQNQGSCSATCGAGLQLQVRFCTNPIPQFGGQDCSSLGPSSQNIPCNVGTCPVNGNYSIWQNQGSCSATCGAGLQLQVRFCTNPIPQFGGQDCSSLGPSSQNVACNLRNCPISGNYTAWQNQGACSRTCGAGFQLQVRFCTNPVPQFGGLDCSRIGPSSQNVACNLRNCPVNGNYSPWQNQGACSRTCGAGFQLQVRFCTNPIPQFGGLDCSGIGPSSQNVACNLRNCPVNGNYTAWQNDGGCSTTCGNGLQRQVRFCANPVPQFGGSDCSALGPSVQNLNCNLRPCEVHGNYSAWVNQGFCSVSCGGGSQRQVRTCTNPVPQNGGRDCSLLGASEQFIPCGNERCPDMCTNQNALDNDFVYDVNNRTYFCECQRTVDNTKSYIKSCYNCPPETLYDPTFQICTLPIQFSCTADPFCVGKTPGDYSIWHGEARASCSNLYYTCDSFQQKVEKSCGVFTSGIHFNHVSRTCVSGSAPSTCSNFQCVGRPNGNYERFDDLCRSYYQCIAFQTNVATCLLGSFYDNQLKRCVVASNPPVGQNCVHPNCQNKADGYYMVDNRCEAYYRCVGQRQAEFVTCPADQYYDPTLQRCSTNYPNGGVCQHKFCIQRSNFAGSYSLTGSSCSNSYVKCQTLGVVPNVLSFDVCTLNTYFLVLDSNTFSGECASSPPAASCANYQCIGRSNGYVVAMSGFHDCSQYIVCTNQLVVLTPCTAGQYFDPSISSCSSNLNVQMCQHPDCLPGGRQASGPGDYPLLQNSQCSAAYYKCDVNKYRTDQSCTISTSGQYFGLQNGLWQCIAGTAPAICGSNYVCIGKLPSGSAFPLYDNPSEPYCTGYIRCSINGIASLATCSNTPTGLVQYLDILTFRCSSTFPTNQNCRRDGGYGFWASWTYIFGSTCSVTCGNDGVQSQQRLRECNNPAPLNGGLACDIVGLSETRISTCQSAPPACGDTFCLNRVAGSYTKSLELTPPTTASCFKDYYICSGPPANTLTLGNCPSADYIFRQGSGCVRANKDASCPALFCASKVDGLHSLSSIVHDCRQYVSCLNEFHTLLNCQLAADGRPTYFNPVTKACEVTPQANCDPVVGYWSGWSSDGLGCSLRSSSFCQSREIRACNNPAPVNDNTGCQGSPERFTTCTADQCGNPFCNNRPNGLYSKSLGLTPPVNLKCFKEYYRCIQPGNIFSEVTCPLADYLFDPVDSTCKRGSSDPNCPNTYCGGLPDGLNQFSVNPHDCRIYLSCSDEFAMVLNCTNDPITNKPRYYNTNFQSCSTTPPSSGLCNPVFGFWSAWQSSGSCFTSGESCIVRQVRSCSDPAPVPSNDPNTACAAGILERFDNCDLSQCASACNSNPCNAATGNTVCTNTPGVGIGYACACNAGYTYLGGNGTTLQCTDINECLTNNGGCGASRICQNLPGSHFCQNERCAATISPCLGTNTQCTSTSVEPGYSCSCLAGNFQSTGIGASLVCTDINECLIGTNNCGLTRVCVNTVGGFTCNADVCSVSATVCTGANAICQSSNIFPGYNCVCPAGYTPSGSGSTVVCTFTTITESCTGKTNGYRIPVVNNPRQYQECQNGIASNTVNCPNVDMSLGIIFPGNIEVNAGNGIWFSPVFKTCVNTTTNAAPAAVPRDASGNYDIMQVCNDMANTPTVTGGVAPTKLPYILDTQCKQWITCLNQELQNASQNPPEAGRCATNFYNRDQRTCTFTLPAGSC